MPPNHFESEVESFLEGSHGDRTHIKRADHHTVTPLCGTLLRAHSYSTWIKHFSRACTRVDLSRSFLEQTEHAHENDYSQLGNRQYARDPRSH